MAQFLYLSNNHISEIKGLDSLINLKKLELDNNYITEIKGLGNLEKLDFLSIGKNKIEEILLERLGRLGRDGGAFKPQKFVEFCKRNK